MSYGLEIFDSIGESVLEIGDRIAVKIAEVIIPEGIGVVNVPVPNIVDDGTWLVVRFGVGIEFSISPGIVSCDRHYNFAHLNGGAIEAGHGYLYAFEDYFRIYRW